MDKIGLLAGYGELPLEFKRLAQKKGYKVITFGVEGITNTETDYIIPFGKVKKFVELLKKENIKKVVFLGKFEHSLIFKNLISLDLTALQILLKSKDKKPETIVRNFICFLESKGFEVFDPKEVLSEILSQKGLMNNVEPKKEAIEDAVFGFPIAKEIASMDIGQTIVVKNKAVVSVEAMEGTQETIRRAGKIAGKNTRVIKVARKNQDFRIDVPTVGIDTLKVMKEVGADSLFLEAGKVYIVRKEEFLRLADKFKITVYGL